MTAMDGLLAAAAESAREPLHWIMPQSDWLAIRECFQQELLADPTVVGANTYKGVPVHFGSVTDNQLVALVDQHGAKVDG